MKVDGLGSQKFPNVASAWCVLPESIGDTHWDTHNHVVKSLGRLWESLVVLSQSLNQLHKARALLS